MLNRLKQFVKRILITTPQRSAKLEKEQTDISIGDFSPFHKELTHKPLDADLHFSFSKYCTKVGNHYLAFAEYQTACALGLEKNKSVYQALLSCTPNKEDLDHNQYYRFRTLADEVKKRAGTISLGEISILDVGGGHGQLAAFLPECSYVLVEPDVNGISGIELPFADKSFDFVLSCHVLEHIPKPDRSTFLDQKLSKCKRGVVLLNPIYVEGTYVEERMDLFIDITDARWAKEHKECELPKVEEVTDHCKDRNLTCEYQSKGTLSTSISLVFAQYFSSKANRSEDMRKVNRFFNKKLIDQQDSESYPAFGLFFITR